MKIAYIYDVIYPYVKGGAEKRFWELAKRLALRGHEVHLFSIKFWQGDAYLVKEGVHLHGVSKPKRLYLKTGIRDVREVLSFTIHILPSLWKERFDIVDCNAFPYLPFFPVKLFSLLKGTPLVITWQEVWDKYWYGYLGHIKGFIARLIERIVINLSDNIVVHSLKTRGELLRFQIYKKNKHIRLISHGVDLEAIEGTSRNTNNNDLIFVGRLIKDKNVETLIRAIFLVKKELDGLKCFVIGEGPEKARLIGLADKLNLKDNIIFKDFLEYEEMISYMKASKIFVFPSTREGFGIVVLEAMACGLPVITVSHPMNAAVELIKDGQNGFICKLDEEDVAKKILQLLRDEALRDKLAKRAKDSIKDYDWNKITNENEEFYRYILGKTC